MDGGAAVFLVRGPRTGQKQSVFIKDLWKTPIKKLIHRVDESTSDTQNAVLSCCATQL